MFFSKNNKSNDASAKAEVVKNGKNERQTSTTPQVQQMNDNNDLINKQKELTVIEKTIIAPNSSITGDIESQCDIQIGGKIDGKITSTAKVYIQKTGIVKGEIKAPYILIDGQVTGTCIGESIEIMEHGKMEGIVKSDVFSISKKGRFIGSSETLTVPGNEIPVPYSIKSPQVKPDTKKETTKESIKESVKESL